MSEELFEEWGGRCCEFEVLALCEEETVSEGWLDGRRMDGDWIVGGREVRRYKRG